MKVLEMGGFSMTVYDRSVREAACGLFDRGAGYKSAARRLGVPPKAVRKWQQTYRAVGRDGLLAMGKTKRSYDHETKVAAARAVVDGGMARAEAMARFGVVSSSPLDAWCRLYREGGAEALLMWLYLIGQSDESLRALRGKEAPCGTPSIPGSSPRTSGGR